MSLDVYLRIPGAALKKTSSGIFVRENGQTKEISEAEWREKHPDWQPVKFVSPEETTDEVFHANITHNLGEMAAAALIYKAIWRPEELGFKTGGDLIFDLTFGLGMLKIKPDEFKLLNPKNGWGTYEQLVAFVENYLLACNTYPHAEISVSE